MARKLNKNMVAGLAVLGYGVLLVAGIALVVQIKPDDPAPFVKRAQEYAAKKEYGEATRFYTQAYYISQDPKYLVEAGKMNYSAGKEPNARDNWARALSIDPTLKEARTRLCEFYMEVAKLYDVPQSWLDLKQNAEELLKLDENDPFGLYCQGLALLALQSQDATYKQTGIESLEKAVELAPENVDYALALAEEQSDPGEQIKSDELWQRLLAGNTEPGDDSARIRWLYAGKIAEKAEKATLDGNAEEAEKLNAQALPLFNEAIELAENKAEARVALATYYYINEFQPAIRDDGDASESFAKIKDLLNAAIESDPRGFNQYLLLADAYLLQGMHDEAIKVCKDRWDEGLKREGLQRNKQKWGAFQVLTAAANIAIDKAASLKPGSAEQQDYLKQAEEFVVLAKGEFPNSGTAPMIEGKILLARGEDMNALEKFREADTKFTGINAENKAYLARLYFVQNEIGLALKEAELGVWQTGQKNTPRRRTSFGSILLLARIHLANNEPSRAAEVADMVLKLKPGDQAALRLQLDAFQKMNRPDRVKEALENLDPSEISKPLAMAKVLTNEGKFAEALAELDQILSENPADKDAVGLAVYIYSQMDDPTAAQAMLTKAMEVDPDNLSFKSFMLTFAQGLSVEERDARREQLLEEIEDPYMRALTLSRFYLEKGEIEKADAELNEAQRLFNEAPTEEIQQRKVTSGERELRAIVNQRFLIAAQRATQSGDEADWKRVREIADEAKSQNLDGVDGLFFYARIHIYRDEPERAVDMLNLAVQKKPDDSQILTSLGQAYQAMDRSNLAQGAFERALEFNPNNGQAHRGLAMILKGTDQAAFDRHLAEAKRLMPNDEWVSREMQLEAEQANPKDGIARRVQLREENPDDFENITRLGQLYARTAQHQEAAESFRKAHEIAPQNIAVCRIAAEYFRAVNDPQAALNLINGTFQANTDPEQKATAQLLLGMHHQALGDTDKAAAANVAAADISPSNSICSQIAKYFLGTRKYEEAISWAEKAIEAGSNEGASAVCPMRLLKAEALTLAGRYDDALRVVNQIPTQCSNSPEASLALLLLSEIEARRGEMQRAIMSLGRFLEQKPGDPRALLRRARYYGNLGYWLRAVDDLEKLKATQKGRASIEPRGMLAVAYEKTQQTDLAISELKSLLAEFPGEQEVAKKLYDIYRANKQYTGAQQVVSQMLNHNPEDAGWHMLGANLAFDQQEVDRGIDLLLQACKLSGYAPAITIQAMDYFSLTGRLDNGIQLYEDTIPIESRVPVLSAGYAGLLARKGQTQEAVRNYRLALGLEVRNRSEVLRAVIVGAANAFGGVDAALAAFRDPAPSEQFARVNQQIIGGLLMMAERFSEAGTIFEQLISTSQDDEEKTLLRQTLGVVRDREGNYEEAVKQYRACLEIKPEDWRTMNNLAYVLSDKLGRHEEALPLARKAVALRDEPTVRDTLATVLIGTGDYSEAIGQLQLVVDRLPEFLDGQMHLADAYRRRGDFEQAGKILAAAEALIQSGGSEADQEKIRQLREKIDNSDSTS